MQLFAVFLINSALGIECERQFTTKSGIKCQRWDANEPHKPNKQMGKFIYKKISRSHAARCHGELDRTLFRPDGGRFRVTFHNSLFYKL